jgi:hypothetical protein
MTPQSRRPLMIGIPLLFALLLSAFCLPALGSDLYLVRKDARLDPSLRPAEGKALIYFMRPQSFGGGVKVKLYADGKFLGFIMSDTFVAYECEPGKHEFVGEAENAGFLEAEVVAGKVYVVQVCIHMGAWKARTHFEVVRPGTDAMHECSKGADRCRAIETTDEGRAWEAKREAGIQETIKRYRDKGEEFEYLKPEEGYDTLPWVKPQQITSCHSNLKWNFISSI